VVSGLSVPKMIPGYVGDPWMRRASPEKCYALAGLLNAAYDRNKATSKHVLADRSAIMDYVIRGSWSIVRTKLEIGQSALPKHEIQDLLNQMTLLE